MSTVALAKPNPISGVALWQSFWVFGIYGIIIGLLLGSASYLSYDLDMVEKLMMEPISLYAFSALTLTGFIGLAITNMLNGMSGEAMHRSKAAKRFWIPIANVGLNTGAIVMGAMLGVSAGLVPWVVQGEKDLSKIALLLFVMSVYVLALLYPVAWFKRSMFDTTAAESRSSTILGAAYCAAMAITFWFMSPRAFWFLIGGSILFSALAMVVGRRLARRGS